MYPLDNVLDVVEDCSMFAESVDVGSVRGIESVIYLLTSLQCSTSFPSALDSAPL